MPDDVLSQSTAAAFDIRDLPALEPSSPLPLYVQLAERLAAQIRGPQTALVGKALPSEAECMAYFKVSRPTVRQAMARLLWQGLITRRRGRGTFVAPQRVDYDLCRAFEHEMRAANHAVAFSLIEWTHVDPPESVRAALRLSPTQPVERMKRLLLLDGEPFGFEERFISSQYSGHLTAAVFEALPIVSLIQEITGEPPARMSLTVRSIAADKETAAALKVKSGTPLLANEHIYFLSTGTPVLCGAVIFHGERCQFSFHTQIVGQGWPKAVLALPSGFHRGAGRWRRNGA